MTDQNDKPKVDSTVRDFVERYVGTGEQTVTLADFWKDYQAATNRPVEREKFKWHLSEAMPEAVEREFEEFHGVSYDYPYQYGQAPE